MKSGDQNWKTGLVLLTVYVVWGTTHFATLVAVQSIPPMFMTGVRFTVAGAVMLAIAGLASLRNLTPQLFLNCAAAGILMSFASMTLAGVAIASGVSSGLMACIVATMPFRLTLLAHLGGEQVSTRSWIGVGLGVTGAFLLLFDGNLGSTPLGTLFAFLSAFAWALGSYWVRRAALPTSLLSPALQWLTGGIVGLLASLMFEVDYVSATLAGLQTSSILAWCYLLVFGTLITYTAYLWLVRNVSAPLAGSCAFVNPVIAVSIGAAFAGERLDSESFWAVALILLALLLLIYRPKASSPVAQPVKT